MIQYCLDRHKEKGIDATVSALMPIEEKAFADPWRPAAMKDSLSAENVRLFTAEEEGRVVGYLLFMEIAPEGEILNLAVDPEKRRCGIGDALMDEMYRYALDNGVDAVFLEVRESNLAARSLYEKKGFLNVGKRKRYYRMPTEDAVVMMLPTREY